MIFFSGFSLQNETHFFDNFLDTSLYTISGFSQGAISALEKTIDLLSNGVRVDTLQLFSPAFFQTKDKKFKKLQMIAYKKNKKNYLKKFLQTSFEPYAIQNTQNAETKEEQLRELLEYNWSVESFLKLSTAGVKIEVYLGGEDKIIDVLAAREFFVKVATVTFIKNANHFLQIH